MPIQHRFAVHYQNNKGFNLLEVLITIIIVSIGVFALASSQIALLKRGDATLTENAIAMQANNMFEYIIAADPTVRGEYTGSAAADSVKEDLKNWEESLAALGVTASTVELETDNTYKITITYQNNGAWGKSNTATSVIYTADVGLQR